MEILNTKQETAEVEAGSGVIADSKFPQEVEEVAAFYILEEEVDEMRVLVTLHQFDDEGEVAGCEDLLLAPQELLHLVLHHHVALDALQRISLLALLVFHKKHSTHLTLPQLRQDVEVFELDLDCNHSGFVQLRLRLHRFFLLYVLDRLFLLVLE